MKNYVIWFVVIVVLLKIFEEDNLRPSKSVDLGVAQFPGRKDFEKFSEGDAHGEPPISDDVG